MAASSCQFCAHYVYDEELGEDVCLVNMDEDEYVRFLQSKRDECPFFRLDDEYAVVRKQN